MTDDTLGLDVMALEESELFKHGQDPKISFNDYYHSYFAIELLCVELDILDEEEPRQILDHLHKLGTAAAWAAQKPSLRLVSKLGYEGTQEAGT